MVGLLRRSCALLLLASLALAVPVDIPISDPADDGEEIDNATWDASASPLHLGWIGDGHVRDLGLRFVAPELAGAGRVLYARLRFSSYGGAMVDSLNYIVTGAMEQESPPLAQTRRPSRLRHTQNQVQTTIPAAWRDGAPRQLFYYTEDISAIINEIIGQPGWGTISPALVLCVDDDSHAAARQITYVACSELASPRWPVSLQVCRTLAETFEGREMLGRPTDRSVTINFVSLVGLEVYVQYGRDCLAQQTAVYTVAAGKPFDLPLTDLTPGAQYEYRLAYRLAGTPDPFEYGEVHQFQTQRPPGEPFTFTVQADPHTWDQWSADEPQVDHLALYERTLQNVAADQPDFHFDMGDFSMTENSKTDHDSWDHYLVQRRYLDEVMHSIPFYLVLGNHEGELGWLYAAGDSVPVWAESARLELIPNPYPDGFYRGCPEPAACGRGLRESYYSWEWGDALFVVLDPFWYTTSRPYHNPGGGGGWDWTLGREQYEWLHDVLSESDRTWKIVLLHHLVGGIASGGMAYGRGGIEVVKHDIDGKPTFEWGGENSDGYYIFPAMRLGWAHGSIHDLLVNSGVKLVIHGHDHFYACQDWDGITYVACPQPCDPSYGFGALSQGEYSHGTLLPNAGHVRFQVTPVGITVEYVRSYLAGGGDNGTIAHSQVIGESLVAAADNPPVPMTMQISPNPGSGQTTIALRAGGAKAGAGEAADLRIFDLAGRQCAHARPPADGVFVWNQRDESGHPVASGVYNCTVSYRGARQSGRVVVVR